eukprot:scaffold40876_cov29-Tisochrysis_lutea.AAC.1
MDGNHTTPLEPICRPAARPSDHCAMHCLNELAGVKRCGPNVLIEWSTLHHGRRPNRKEVLCNRATFCLAVATVVDDGLLESTSY